MYVLEYNISINCGSIDQDWPFGMMGLLGWLWAKFCSLLRLSTNMKSNYFTFCLVLKYTGLGYYLQDLIGQADSLELFLETRSSLTKTYGPIHFPFFEGSFNSAKKEFIKREEPNLILLVYCHADNSPYSKQTMNDIICHKETASKFDRPDVITWMCDIRSNLTYYYLIQKLGFEGTFPAFLFLSEFKGKLRLESSIQGILACGSLYIDYFNSAYVTESARRRNE
jgi:hypothetical protein